jgi:exopolysaccharide biosynthesis polyprenyl glycosylphosphotransferase
MTTATPPVPADGTPVSFAGELAGIPHIGPRAHAAGRAAGPIRQLAAAVLERRNWSRLRLAVDCVLLYVASLLTLITPARDEGTAGNVAIAVFPLLVLALAHARPGPDQRLYGSALDTVFHILGTVSTAVVATMAGSATFGATHPVGLSSRLWVFGALLLGAGRLVLVLVRRRALASETLAIPTLVVGAGAVGERLVMRLRSDHRYGLRPVGFLDSMPRFAGRSDALSGLPVLGGPDDLSAAVDATAARHVILAFSNEPDHLLIEKVRECERLGVDVSLVPRLFESISVHATLDHVGGMPLVGLRQIDPKGWQFAIKHALGRTIAAVALLVLAPVFLLIAAAVALTSPGPVLYRQRRVGRDGREFDLLKFRSMRVPTREQRLFVPSAGSAPGGVEGEDRRTWIGRLIRRSSLDELPQVINVLRGDMTIVGPRPERPEYVERFVNEIDHYRDRHRVKSGITGWAQVNGLRGQTSIEDRVEWDNYYIQNWSLRLDLRIIALTVVEVFRFRDA